MAMQTKRAFLVGTGISLIVFLAVAALWGIWPAAVAALLAVSATAPRWAQGVKTKQPRAAALWGAVTLGHLAAAIVAGGPLVGAYILAMDYTRGFCAQIDQAPTVAERRALLAEMDDKAWLKSLMERLTDKGEFVFDCDRQAYELRVLEQEGACPTYLPEGIECKCGADHHASTDRCAPPLRAVCSIRTYPYELVCKEP